jgi:hypothetical protein
VEELREAVLWAGGLSDVQRATLRTMLQQWGYHEQQLQAMAIRVQELESRPRIRASQGG